MGGMQGWEREGEGRGMASRAYINRGQPHPNETRRDKKEGVNLKWKSVIVSIINVR